VRVCGRSWSRSGRRTRPRRSTHGALPRSPSRSASRWASRAHACEAWRSAVFYTTSASSRSLTRSCRSPGLDDDEFAVIKTHPERGRELLEELGGFDESVTRLVLDHHERLDGRGYPRGLKADDLDLATRILAVCDVYDALVSPRVYRDAWPVEKALAHLQSEADTSFDSRCVTALILVLAGKPSEQSNGAVQGLGPLGARLAFPS
jgi:hypothetical protein